MKILITGGHPAPAFAVADKIDLTKHKIFFIGRKYSFEGDGAISFEYNTCLEKNIPFIEINTGRVQRKITLYSLTSLFKIFPGIIRSFLIVKRIKPDLLLTFGGYVGFPVSLAAFFLGVPVVLHEQSQKFGLSGKIIAYLAKKVCVSFPNLNKKNDGKIIFTGNPVRKEIFTKSKNLNAKNNKKIIYITGGSAGSHFINEQAARIIGKLISAGFIIIHQTGDSRVFKDFIKLEKIKKELPVDLRNNYIIKKFFSAQEIAGIYHKASLIIGRAGINTVFELLATKNLSLLIPLSWGTEQLENAKFVKNLGVGEYITASKLSGDTNLLYNKIIYLLDNAQKYKLNFSKTEKYVISDAAEKIINVLENVYEEKTKKKI